MSEPEQISYLLQLIDEWVDQLQEDELPAKCRQSGQDFFNYMRSRQVYAGWMAQVVLNATGHPANKLWLRADAATLRSAVRAYESSVCIAKHTDDNPYDIIKRQWS